MYQWCKKALAEKTQYQTLLIGHRLQWRAWSNGVDHIHLTSFPVALKDFEVKPLTTPDSCRNDWQHN